jgi:preprotein translocase subunit SecE
VAEATRKTADSAGKDLPAPAPVRRGGLVQFYRDVIREGIQKVTWPTPKETYYTTVMVFIMVALMMVFFFGVDWVLSTGERLLIGAIR